MLLILENKFLLAFPAVKAAIVLRGANYSKKLAFLVGCNKHSSLQNFTSVCQRPTTVWGGARGMPYKTL